ncbi:MAG: stalk domain-containing protein [Bacillota bacterium]
MLLGVAVLVASIGLPSSASADPAIRVFLDGSQLSFPVAPVAESGTILVPLRAIFEALGATVTFDSGVITAAKGDKVVQLTLGSATARVGQDTRQLQVPAKAVSGSTLVPLRFVSEAFDAKVSWDQDTRSVIILSANNDTTISPPTQTAAATGQLKIHFIDVGQGDASLIQTPGGKNILVDAGDTFASSVVVSYLQSEGVKSLDVVVISHPHTDHIGGMAQVLSSFASLGYLRPGLPADHGYLPEPAQPDREEGHPTLPGQRRRVGQGRGQRRRGVPRPRQAGE